MKVRIERRPSPPELCASRATATLAAPARIMGTASIIMIPCTANAAASTSPSTVTAIVTPDRPFASDCSEDARASPV